MTECLNDAIRDRLPELAHGLLAAGEAEVVRAHVSACPACAAELAALETTRLVLQAGAVRIDTAAIVRAVTTPAPSLRVERGGAAPAVRVPAWRSRQWIAAAASVLIVFSLSLPLLDRSRGEAPTAARPDTAVAVRPDSPAAPASASGLSLSGGLADLSADDLTALLAELEQVEATIAAEPVTLRQPLVDTPEGL